MTQKTYAVKKGKSDFFPPEFPTLITFGRSILRWTINIEANCWYDSLGTDNADWNKLCGVTRAISANNVDSCMIAWRPLTTEPGYFEICVYENIGKDNFPHENNIRVVTAGEQFTIEFQPALRDCMYDVFFHRQNSMEHWDFSNFRQRFTLFRRIGLWFGGNQKAPQEMYIRLGFETRRANQDPGI